MSEETQNETMTHEAMREAFITMAVESWKLARAFGNMLRTIEPHRQNRYMDQLRCFSKTAGETMDVTGLSFVSIEGQYFDPNMAVTPVNLEEFAAQDLLVIEQMLEPIVMGKDMVLRPGTVLLRKAEI